MTKELREKRAALAKKAGAILKKAGDAKRALTGEEQAEFDRIHADIERMRIEIDRRERGFDDRGLGRDTQPGCAGETTAADRSMALRGWLLNSSIVGVSDAHREAAERCGLNLNGQSLKLSLANRAPRSVAEARALGVASGSVGLFTVPDDLMRTLEESLLHFGGMRENATVIRTASGADLPIPTVDDTAQKGVILAENTAAAEQDVAFGQIILQAYKYSSKLVRVSVELLQDSGINLEEYLGRALGTRIARITNEHFTKGTGTGQPNGVVTAAGVGKTGTTGQTTSVIYDDLVDLQHSVDPAYRDNAKWMMHDSTLKVIKKLKDSQNRPLWLPGVADKEPDTILGSPYFINQDVAVMAANARSILYGDVGKYMIRDVLGLTLLRLDERYADSHQVAFIAFSRHDGDLLDAGTDPVKVYVNSAT